MAPPPRWDRDSIVRALQADARRRGRAPTAAEWQSSPKGGWGARRPTSETVRAIMGGWSEALREAGLETRGRGPGSNGGWTLASR